MTKREEIARVIDPKPFERKGSPRKPPANDEARVNLIQKGDWLRMTEALTFADRLLSIYDITEKE